MEELRMEMIDLKEEVKGLRVEVDGLKEENKSLSKKLSASNKEHEREMRSVRRENIKMLDQLDEMESELEAAKQSKSTTTPSDAEKDLKEASHFDIRMETPRNIEADSGLKIDYYDVMDTHSDFMNIKTGIYTTPSEALYEFNAGKDVWGVADVNLYVCGSDGRREFVDGELMDMGWRCAESVVWKCPEGLKVWVEVESREEDQDTNAKARFFGWMKL